MDTKPDILDTTIEYIKGIGPAKAELMQKELKVFRVRDLLSTYPFRYVDKTKFHVIKDVTTDGDTVQLKGQLVSFEKIKGKNNRFRLQGLLKDSTGFIELIWFQGVKYLTGILKEGE
ncbi:MAG: ATP-dependent DNA helicase RecG, partial [Saprospiraceae bacterium]